MNEQRQDRGKRVDGGGWVEGWYVELSDGTDGVGSVIYPIGSAGCFHEVILDTVGQSTGLKDKNGKGQECYKGDLLGSRYFSTVLVVDQITEGPRCGEWIAKQKDGGYQDLWEAITADGYKVIGNITDDPKLLERSRR